MKHAFRFVLAVLAVAVLQSASAAAPVTYNVDKSHSEVGFDIRHFFSKVHGRFNSFTGKIVFDDANPANISVEASADANSIWTDNERRDGHLKGADFFDAEKFPLVTFKSTKVTAAGKGKYKVAGDFTMHGVTKPITFTLTGGKKAEFPKGTHRIGFTTDLTIKRSEFGMDKSIPAVGDEVHIAISFEGVKK